MQRYFTWFCSAIGALVVYAVLNALNLNQAIVLVLTFLGALVGAVVAAAIIQRREVQAGVEPGSSPAAPDPGSERTAK